MDQATIAIIANHLIEVVVSGVMLVLLPWALKRLNMALDNQTRDYVETALRAGLKYAIEQYATTKGIAIQSVAKESLENDTLRQELIATANDYVQRNVPTGAKKMALDTGTQATEVLSARVVDVAAQVVNDAPTPRNPSLVPTKEE